MSTQMFEWDTHTHPQERGASETPATKQIPSSREETQWTVFVSGDTKESRIRAVGGLGLRGPEKPEPQAPLNLSHTLHTVPPSASFLSGLSATSLRRWAVQGHGHVWRRPFWSTEHHEGRKKTTKDVSNRKKKKKLVLHIERNPTHCICFYPEPKSCSSTMRSMTIGTLVLGCDSLPEHDAQMWQVWCLLSLTSTDHPRTITTKTTKKGSFHSQYSWTEFACNMLFHSVPQIFCATSCYCLYFIR